MVHGWLGAGGGWAWRRAKGARCAVRDRAGKVHGRGGVSVCRVPARCGLIWSELRRTRAELGRRWALRTTGLLSPASEALLWRRPVLSGVESPMSFGWFPSRDGTRMSISGSNAGVQAALSVWKAQDVEVAVLANSWGRGSRSGELMNDEANGFVGRLAAVCGVLPGT